MAGLPVKGMPKMLLIGLTLSITYGLVVPMTMFAPRLCRRGSAQWTAG